MATSTEIITVETCGGVRVATILTAELNAAESDRLGSALLAELQEEGIARFVIDFQHVQFVDSSCLGALVTFLKWVARFDGAVALANVHENVRFLFSVTRLNHAFPIYKSVPDALSALGA